jgi:GDP-L-fucose synthase
VIDTHARIYVAGHRGMVGSAIVRALKARGYDNLLLRTSKELDLRDNGRVAEFFCGDEARLRVSWPRQRWGVFWQTAHCPAEFIYDNLAIQTNVIHHAYVHGVKKLAAAGILLHLPERFSSTDEGGVSADRPAGADQ